VQALVDLLSRELQVNPCVERVTTYKSFLQMLLAKTFHFIPSWKEETMGIFCLDLARRYREEALALSQTTPLGVVNVKSELRFFFFIVVLNGYDRALKLLAIVMVHLTISACADCLEMCVTRQAPLLKFLLSRQMVEEATNLLKRLLAEIDRSHVSLAEFAEKAKILLGFAGPSYEQHLLLIFERLTSISKVLKLLLI
jgi:hypothetical protein